MAMSTQPWVCVASSRSDFCLPSLRNMRSHVPLVRASERDPVTKATIASSSKSPSSSLDVSVFRFTLGIPGFDDSDLPRVIGIASGAILLLNHLLTSDVVPPAQLRSEFVGFCSAVFAVALPAIGRRINGQSSRKASSLMSNRQIFVLAKHLSYAKKEELAWGSYAILKNTKTTSLAIWYEGLLCVRGFWDVPLEGEKNVLGWLEKMLDDALLLNRDSSLYVPTNADKQGWKMISKGVVCAIILSLKELIPDATFMNGGIMLLSNMPYAYSSKDKLWISLLMKKLFKSIAGV